MCKKQKNNINESENNSRKVEISNGTINNLISLVAIVLSIVSFFQSKQLLDYQIAQERLPNVVTLNHEISKSFEVYNDEIYSYDSINDISIPVYNIGVGVAKNCEIKWNIDSVKNACLKAKDILKDDISIAEYDFSKDGLPSAILYDYFFEYKDGRFITIEFYDKILERYEIEFDENTIKIPYVLPIDEQQTNEFINMPKSIAVFLLEYANHNIQESIDIELSIFYEDISGESFTKTYNTSFSLKNREVVQSEDLLGNDIINYTFDISVSEK